MNFLFSLQVRLQDSIFQKIIACSKRSHSGERCEVKKASHRSPLSERLEQAKKINLHTYK